MTQTDLTASETTSTGNPEGVDLLGALRYANPAMLSRYAKEHGTTPEYAEKLFLETKKFLVLCALRKGDLSPSEEQDKMWHHFIVHTVEYAQFCATYLGAFVHHVPCDGTRPDRACQTKMEARKIFFSIDESLWAVPTGVTRCCGYC